MEHVLFRYHNKMGHVGTNKMIENIRATYWFPNIRQKYEEHVRHCLKCILFSPGSGKAEYVTFYNILGKAEYVTSYIVVVDAFSQLVRLYAVKTTSSKESMNCLANYFQCYNIPKILHRG